MIMKSFVLNVWDVCSCCGQCVCAHTCVCVRVYTKLDVWNTIACVGGIVAWEVLRVDVSAC